MHNTIGDQVPHRVTPVDSRATIGGADGKRGHFKGAYALFRETANAQSVARARNGDEMRKLPELLVVLLFEDLSDRIRPRDEEQISVWPVFPEISEGIDGVRGPRAVDIDPAHREPRIGGCGDRRHEVAMLCL